MAAPVYVLGGYQTDFARNWTKENKHVVAMMREAVTGGLEATGIDPREIEVGHVGNFAAELYSMQGHLGAFLVDTDPAFSGLPTSRHEAACASGSIAIWRAAQITCPRASYTAAARCVRSTVPVARPRRYVSACSGNATSAPPIHGGSSSK